MEFKEPDENIVNFEEDEVIDKAVTESVTEIQEQEQKLKDDFEEFEQMEAKCKQQFNQDDALKHIQLLEALHIIDKSILKVDKDVLDLKKQDYKYSIHTLQELHFIRKHQGKFIFIAMGTVLLAGVAIGTQYQAWIPYLNGITEFLKLASKG